MHHESVFGDAIVSAMVDNDVWELGSSSDYRPELGLDTAQLYAFIGETQPEEWEELLAFYGDDPDAAQLGFAKRVGQAIETEGLLDVLRRGVKDRGVRIRVAYFKPSLVRSDDVLDDYRRNRLTVVRELEYATKYGGKGKRLDLALFLNGIPVATAELKNPITGQGVEQAKQQYRHDRDPSEPIFAKRVVANFAVDPGLVFVAPQLRGKATRFLPFNQGSAGAGESGGRGNPKAKLGKYATSYLWEEVWQSDNWLDLLERFVHLAKEKGPDGRVGKTLIFPRYHQWDAVRRMSTHAATHGSGHNYLVMHSAGSGKSNTIAWLAHRLTSLHTPTDPAALDPAAVKRGIKPGEPVFDKTIIITDRTNLDGQLRETVGSFEQTAGLVVKVDGQGEAKSAQLAKALSSSSGKILTVTLQTFPALVDYLRENPVEIQGRRFAIIVDEAHSSQSGDAATAVRKTLRGMGLDADDEDQGAAKAAADDVEAKLKEMAAERGHSDNLSYFAFTATPKHKTLELFGELRADGHYWPFHTYSMRQAIDEGFILDPLRNYVTYGTFWKLVNNNPTDREVDPAKANPLLARVAAAGSVPRQAHEIVEHFRTHTAGRVGGRAKAMVVTGSRHSAVQMSRAIKQHIKDQGYKGIGVLVAFSGSLPYDGEEVTESSENGGLPEKGLPKAFAYTRQDDSAVKKGGAGQTEYRILVVAEKYQTGFDQPLLTTMYVGKKLAGIAAVQTLSRLNRTAPRKSQADLAVLDFVNDTEQIQDAFRDFYEVAATLPSDPNMLYQAQSRVMRPDILLESEMRAFAEAYTAADATAGGDQGAWAKLHPELYRHIEPAAKRHAELLFGEDEDDQQTAEDFRADLQDYTRKYAFLSQIVHYRDAELELLYRYGRYLLNRLERRQDGSVDIGEIDLSHLRLEKTGEHDLGLAPEGPVVVDGFGDGAGGAQEPEKSPLSELVEKFNERYGTEFTEQDVLTPFEEAKADRRVRLAAVATPDPDAFGPVFDEVFEDKMIDHIDSMAELGRKYFEPGGDFRSRLNGTARRAAWNMIRREEGVEEVA
ncbi:type I restriction endonuclease subunit R [Actinomadura sp. CNU-125]|uniref:type I restriction endonuclease subunit R n=1 Tax=Actinomadura sp. CNU-125 TaxID=1904961 RepID=UPI0021CCCA9C|nr:type I restriction endonuclease [Actinomadura sp. CNU-125]